MGCMMVSFFFLALGLRTTWREIKRFHLGSFSTVDVMHAMSCNSIPLIVYHIAVPEPVFIRTTSSQDLVEGVRIAVVKVGTVFKLI